MPNHLYLADRIQTLHRSDAKLVSDARRTINESLELLREGSPDTFLGRDTHEPFAQPAKK